MHLFISMSPVQPESVAGEFESGAHRRDGGPDRGRDLLQEGQIGDVINSQILSASVLNTARKR